MFQQVTKQCTYNKYFAQNFRFGDQEQTYYKIEGYIYSKFTRSFGEGVEAQSKVARIGTMIIIKYWQNFKQLDKRSITWKNRARIWRTS